MAGFFYNLGKMVGQSSRKANWVIQSLSGNDEHAIEAENAVGKDLAQAYVQESELDSDPEVQFFLNGIASRLVECVADPQRRFAIRAVNSKEFNAFAMPGGFIFVTRPLLEMCDWNRDEIAFVLGHEMGHVIARHAVNRMMASSMIRASLARVPIGGLVGMGVLQVVTTLLNQGYSQDQELEADNLGMKLIHFADFDLDAGKRVLIRLSSFPAQAWLGSSYFSSHPPAHVRIDHIDRYIQEQKKKA